MLARLYAAASPPADAAASDLKRPPGGAPLAADDAAAAAPKRARVGERAPSPSAAAAAAAAAAAVAAARPSTESDEGALAGGRLRLVDRSVLEALPDLRCTVCLTLKREPTELACGHTFCRACLVAALAERRACPECRVEVAAGDLSAPSKPLVRMLATLRVHCPLAPPGERKQPAESDSGGGGGGGGGGGEAESERCAWTGSLGDAAEHVARRCPLAPAPCPNACGVSAPRGQLARHAPQCARRSAPCADCREAVEHGAREAHGAACARRLVACDGSAGGCAEGAQSVGPGGCGARMLRALMAAHGAQACPEALVRCPLAGRGCDGADNVYRRADEGAHAAARAGLHLAVGARLAAALDGRVAALEARAGAGVGDVGAALAEASPLIHCLDADGAQVLDTRVADARWTRYSTQPHAVPAYAGAATHGTRLFVGGGVARAERTRDFWSFEALLGQRTALADLPAPRCGHLLLATAADVFLVGGEDGKEVSRRCWAYGRAAKAWRELAPMAALGAAAGAPAGTTRLLVFRHECYNRYAPADDEWLAVKHTGPADRHILM